MSLKQLNKKLLIIIGIVSIVLIGVMIFFSILNKNRNLSFNIIEEKMKKGAVKLLKNNDERMPKNNGDQTIIDITELEQGKYIPSMNKMVKGDTICNGEVRVLKNNDVVLYIPYLNCGLEHVTVELAKKLIEEDLVTSGDGLYEINGEYVYRGETVQNVVKFNDRTWRILKIDKDNDLKLFDSTLKTEMSVWDDRYNPEKKMNTGYNIFNKSRIYENLKRLFKDDNYLSKESRALVIPKNICIGPRLAKEVKNDGSVECSKVMENEPLGLMQVNEYLIVSLEPTCKDIYDQICENYNYLTNTARNWLSITPYAKNSFEVYRINAYGASVVRASATGYIKPTLYLSSNVIFEGGTGTLSDPYIIK